MLELAACAELGTLTHLTWLAASEIRVNPDSVGCGRHEATCIGIIVYVYANHADAWPRTPCVARLTSTASTLLTECCIMR